MRRSNIKFVTAMLIFGFNGILASFISWRSYEIVLSRTIIGGLSLLLFMIFQRKKLVFLEKKSGLKILMLSGFLMGINWMFLYEAFKHLGVGLAQILCCSGPAVAMVLSPIIFKEDLKRYKIVGFLIVVIGMFLISSNDLSGGLSYGLLCGILSCLSYAAFLICNHFVPEIKSPERTMWQLFMASIVVLIFTLYKGNGMPTDFSLSTIAAVIVLGIVNTALAMNLMISTIQKLPLQTVGIYAYLEPMSALIFSVILLGEHVSMIQVVGIILILVGTAFSELYGLRKKKSPLQ